MSHALPARWLAVVPAMAALAAVAQPASPVAAASAPAYKSAFEGYQAFADDPPIPWRQANGTVRERGGWKAYAQEAQRPSAPDAPKGGPHAGHAMPMPATRETP